VTNLLQVNELTMQNEYQLRLKDLAMNEKVKELTEKFTAELDVDKTKFDTLLQEKNEQELDYEEKMKQYEEKHQAQLTTLDGQYQAKIMAEVERQVFFGFFACFHRRKPRSWQKWKGEFFFFSFLHVFLWCMDDLQCVLLQLVCECSWKEKNQSNAIRNVNRAPISTYVTKKDCCITSGTLYI